MLSTIWLTPAIFCMYMIWDCINICERAQTDSTAYWDKPSKHKLRNHSLWQQYSLLNGHPYYEAIFSSQPFMKKTKNSPGWNTIQFCLWLLTVCFTSQLNDISFGKNMKHVLNLKEGHSLLHEQVVFQDSFGLAVLTSWELTALWMSSKPTYFEEIAIYRSK